MKTLLFIAHWTLRLGVGSLAMLLVGGANTHIPAPSLTAEIASSFAARTAGTAQQHRELAQRQQDDSTHLAAATALEQLVTASANQVLDAASLAKATADIKQVRDAIALAQMNWTSYAPSFGIGWSPLPTAPPAVSLPTSLIAADSAAVTAAVVAWQDRPILRAAAARAPVATGPKHITVFVRTTVDTSGGDNGQSAINAGGDVGVIYPGYGTIVSAHNTQDARALSLHEGDIVTFTGAVQGTYSVTGAIDVLKGSSVSSVSALGASMMMQTCVFGTNLMRIVGMSAV